MAAPAARTSGRAAVIHGEHDRLRIDGPHARWIGAAEGEDGLVGVAREQHGVRAASEHPHQLHLLRIEILRVVDDEVPHPRPLGREQLGICRERIERRRHQLGRVQRRRRGLRRASPRRPPEQRDLLVAAEEPARRGPLGDLVPRAELGQLVRAEGPLGGPQKELAQLGGEPRHHQRRLDPLGPARARDDTVDLTAQQIADKRVLLGAREQAGRRIAVPRGVQAEHAEGVGVDGADRRLAARPHVVRAEAHQALPQLRRGAAASDQHQCAGGILPRGQASGYRGEQQRGLARAGAAEDPQRPRRVREHAPRRLVPDPLGLRGPGAPHERGSERCGHGRDATTRPRQFRAGTRTGTVWPPSSEAGRGRRRAARRRRPARGRRPARQRQWRRRAPHRGFGGGACVPGQARSPGRLRGRTCRAADGEPSGTGLPRTAVTACFGPGTDATRRRPAGSGW